ncbi:hypothetical protein KHA93_18965 [Bacillus sp. FJAT-49732]|uniref:Uncharacterized protein n=1 Tax=Lederbergia citrisecunda TaxID=2833583 RepID=A0A942TQH3_9BACI|nr:hypothetical protein [Lederbergia citrisecunda]MBS4201688.1 hypothetical protein [Lederbergia citrisecunda]
MGINFDITFNVIAVLSGTVAWGVIALIAYRIYKKQIVKPKVWKILIVLFVGLFSFSFNWNLFNTLVKFPILPLGVWILYLFLRGKKEVWQTYRAYAWLGFWANFIFLVSTLIEIPVDHVIYPKDKLSTYIANVENVYIVPTHLSAKKGSLNKDRLLQHVHSMQQETIYSEKWYLDTYMNRESNHVNERFPYQLIGTLPKWGSNLPTIIYIEEDGKGILLSSPNKQLYFRSDDSLIEGGDKK